MLNGAPKAAASTRLAHGTASTPNSAVAMACKKLRTGVSRARRFTADDDVTCRCVIQRRCQCLVNVLHG
jgi:hypothetical protein